MLAGSLTESSFLQVGQTDRQIAAEHVDCGEEEVLCQRVVSQSHPFFRQDRQTDRQQQSMWTVEGGGARPAGSLTESSFLQVGQTARQIAAEHVYCILWRGGGARPAGSLTESSFLQVGQTDSQIAAEHVDCRGRRCQSSGEFYRDILYVVGTYRQIESSAVCGLCRGGGDTPSSYTYNNPFYRQIKHGFLFSDL